MDNILERMKHNEYLKDKEKVTVFKQNLKEGVRKLRLPIIKKIQATLLVEKLSRIQFLLEEEQLFELTDKEETWKCDYFEYNVNMVYDYIIRNNIQKTKVNVQEVATYTMVEYEKNMLHLLSEELRKSKERNPEIILISDIFSRPFIINGNHRIRSAYKNGNEYIELYVINADDVVNCLISDGYQRAYYIFKKLNKIFPFSLTV